MTRILIIGGGVIGSSTAWHLAREGLAADVTVVEPDPSYTLAATPKSTGGVRVLFSVPENIRMSQYGHEVYGNFGALLAVDGEPAPIDYRKRGYLWMTDDPVMVRALEDNLKVQHAEGANVLLLGPEEIRARYPSLEVEDVVLGAFTPDDATIDPYSALMGFRRKAISMGVRYLQDRVVGLEVSGHRVDRVRLESGRSLTPEHVVNAANCWAPPLCEQVGMPIPVAPMRRMNFYFECRAPLEDFPLVRHLSLPGSFRPEGAGYITGISNYHEPRGFNWQVDEALFNDRIWPGLARRVKAFESIRLANSWACHYDQNDLDANLIIGNWPGRLDNFYLACGLSGHGLQQAPAIGRALTELIVHGRYQTLDLTRLGYQRVLDNVPLAENGPIA